jgi:ElaB/YqjD/DUF883 family membrane-anchored ribosome-binding protein
MAGINSVVRWFSDTGSEIAKQGVLGYTASKARNLVAGVTFGLQSINTYMNGIASQAASGVTDLITSGQQQLEAYLGEISRVYSQDGVLGVAQKLVADYIGKITDLLTSITDIGGKALDWIDNKLQKAADFLGLDYKGAKSKVKQVVTSTTDTVRQGVSTAAASSQQAVQKATDVVAPLAGNVARSTVSGVGSAVTTVGSAAGSAVESVGQATGIKSVAQAGSVIRSASGKAGASISGSAEQVGSSVASGVKAAGGAVAAGLGALSAKYESGPAGVAAVGYDKAGGTSYGNYQIASNTGMMDKFLTFLESTGHSDWAAKLRAAGPANTGSTKGKFPDAWRQLAKSGGKDFAEANHKFIENTSYAPLLARIKKVTGVDIASKSTGLQDAVWSTSVNHGSAFKIISKAIVDAGGAQASDKSIIEGIYKGRQQLVNKLADRAESKGDASTAKMYRGMATNRYATEKVDALAMVDKPTAAPSSGSRVALNMAPDAVAGYQPVSSFMLPTQRTENSPVADARVPSTKPTATRVQAVETQVARVAPQTLTTNVHQASAAPAKDSRGSQVIPGNTVDSVPAYISDEGLLILNVNQLV